MRVTLVLTLSLVVAPLLCGCGGSKFRVGSAVNGKVLYNGNPVTGAKVIFTDGKAGGSPNGPTAVTDETGQFVLVGVPPATYKVVVYKLIPKVGVKLPEEGEGMDLEQIEAAGVGTHALPKKYASPTTTTLTAVVDASTVNVDLKLEGKLQ
jgi:hypothetical protein